MVLLLCFCIFFVRFVENTIKGVDIILIKNVDNLYLFVEIHKIKYLHIKLETSKNKGFV